MNIRRILLASAALIVAAGLYAQDNDSIRLGYCSDNYGGTLSAQTDAAADIGAAICLPASVLKKYAGDKITRIQFAITDQAGIAASVFVTKDLGGTALSSVTIRNHKSGWNSVKLNKEVTITGDEDLYVGYVVSCSSADDANKKIITCDFNSIQTPDVNYYGMNNMWWPLQTAVNYNLAICAFAKGDNRPEYDLGIERVDASDIVWQNQSTSADILLRNFGVEPVTSMEVEALTNGEVFDTKTVSGLNIAHNARTSVNVRGIVFPGEGNNTFSLRVKSVNNAEDSDPTDNEYSKDIYSIREGAEEQVRRTLFELYTSEKDEQGAYADQVYGEAVDKASNIIWVRHHDNDGFTLPEEAPYMTLFTNNTIFTPACLVDRSIFDGVSSDRGPAYFIDSDETLGRMFTAQQSVPTYVNIPVKAVYDASAKKINVTVDAESQVKEMPFQNSLRLTTYLVEDSIVSTTQKGSTSFVQNGVIRKILSGDAWGDAVSFDNYKASFNYNVAVADDWRPEHMRVVAFVNNVNATDPTADVVYNAGEAPVQTANAISAIEQTSNAITEYFDITGKRLNAKPDKGLYVERKVVDGKAVVSKQMAK